PVKAGVAAAGPGEGRGSQAAFKDFEAGPGAPPAPPLPADAPRNRERVLEPLPEPGDSHGEISSVGNNRPWAQCSGQLHYRAGTLAGAGLVLGAGGQTGAPGGPLVGDPPASEPLAATPANAGRGWSAGSLPGPHSDVAGLSLALVVEQRAHEVGQGRV